MARSQDVSPAARPSAAPRAGAPPRSTQPNLERAAVLSALRRLSARAEAEALPAAAALLRQMVERAGQAPASSRGQAAASFCAGAVHREQD